MLTRSGLGASVLAVVLAGLGLWWRYEELVVAAAGIAVIVLAAIWVARRPLRGTVDRRIGAVRVPRGDPVNVVCRIRNTSRFRTGQATIIDRCDGATCRITVEPVPAHSAVEVHGAIPTTRRGIFPVGPLDVQRIDPFSLAIGTRRTVPDGAVTVHPRVYRLIGPQGAIRVVESDSVMRRATADPLSGFISMREYVSGDDPRLIHWPTTARTGVLMVREHVEVRRPEFTVVLDTATTAGSALDFEEAVDVAASLAAHAIRTGLDVVVRTTSRTHPGRPTPLIDEATVLDLLTPVAQTSGGDLLTVASLFTHGFDQTSVIVVTGPDGPSSRFANLDRMMIVRIGDGAERAPGVTVAATNAAEFVQHWRAWS